MTKLINFTCKTEVYYPNSKSIVWWASIDGFSEVEIDPYIPLHVLRNEDMPYQVEVSMKLFRWQGSTKKTLKYMRNRKHRPGNLTELIAFADKAKYVALQEDKAVVALNAKLDYRDVTGRRREAMVWCDQPGRIWRGFKGGLPWEGYKPTIFSDGYTGGWSYRDYFLGVQRKIIST